MRTRPLLPNLLQRVSPQNIRTAHGTGYRRDRANQDTSNRQMLGRVIQAPLRPPPHVFPVLCRTSQKIISHPKRVRVSSPPQGFKNIQEIITKETGITAQAIEAHSSAHCF